MCNYWILHYVVFYSVEAYTGNIGLLNLVADEHYDERDCATETATVELVYISNLQDLH